CLQESGVADLCLRIVRGVGHEGADAPHALALLRARRKRPRGSSTAEQRDELASPYVEHGLLTPEPFEPAYRRLMMPRKRPVGPWGRLAARTIARTAGQDRSGSLTPPCPLMGQLRLTRRGPHVHARSLGSESGLAAACEAPNSRASAITSRRNGGSFDLNQCISHHRWVNVAAQIDVSPNCRKVAKRGNPGSARKAWSDRSWTGYRLLSIAMLRPCF